MGERKGVNKYYPPDYDPSKGGLNKFQGTHALRERARKLHLGILIIRFEMPYNIWCDGCGNHIGTGVRYNAEKKKVDMYYTTPVYQFRMKCHLCDNHFEIKTDPANLDYEIVSGARRQERRWDPSENEQVAPEDKAVGRKMASDAMFKLEHGAADKTKAKALDNVIKDLEDFQDSRYADDFSANQALRQSFRKKENAIKAQEKIDARHNLNVPLLPPSSEDTKQAALLAISKNSGTDSSADDRKILDSQSVFAKLRPRRVSKAVKKDVAIQSISNIVAAGTKSFDTFTNDFAKELTRTAIVKKRKLLNVVMKTKDTANGSIKKLKETGYCKGGNNSCNSDKDDVVFCNGITSSNEDSSSNGAEIIMDVENNDDKCRNESEFLNSSNTEDSHNFNSSNGNKFLDACQAKSAIESTSSCDASSEGTSTTHYNGLLKISCDSPAGSSSDLKTNSSTKLSRNSTPTRCKLPSVAMDDHNLVFVNNSSSSQTSLNQRTGGSIAKDLNNSSIQEDVGKQASPVKTTNVDTCSNSTDGPVSSSLGLLVDYSGSDSD